MKRIVLAGVAALAVTLACQQKASAWGWQFNGNIGISMGASFECYGCCTCPPTCWSACPGYCYGGYGYGGYPAPVYAAAPVYTAAPAAYAPYPYYAPTAQPQAPAVAAQPTVQSAGYNYYGGSYAYGNYGSYQAPSYWYGR